jgi:hypothetical protein
VEEVIHLPATVGGLVAVHPIVFHQVMDTVPASGWQVVQEADEIKVLLSGVREGVEDQRLIDSLRKALKAQGVVVPPLKVPRVLALPRTAAGKAPLVKAYAP